VGGTGGFGLDVDCVEEVAALVEEVGFSVSFFEGIMSGSVIAGAVEGGGKSPYSDIMCCLKCIDEELVELWYLSQFEYMLSLTPKVEKWKKSSMVKVKKF
jgi:hypothetical protein